MKPRRTPRARRRRGAITDEKEKKGDHGGTEKAEGETDWWAGLESEKKCRKSVRPGIKEEIGKAEVGIGAFVMGLTYIREQIRSYIQSGMPGALLINGKWGSGKTYYVTQELPKITQSAKRVFFVSLNGVNSVQDLQGRIVSAVAIAITEKRDSKKVISIFTTSAKALTGVPSVAKFLPTSSSLYPFLDWLIGKNKDSVFCFDDLERLERSQMKAVLGYLQDSLIEKLNCRVVFIANEAEIPTDSEYFKIKEKSILISLDFAPQIKDYLRSLVANNKYQEPFFSFIKERVEYIASIVQSLGITNIRTVQFALFYLENLAGQGVEGLLDYLTQDRLTAIFCLAHLHREGLVLTHDELEKVLEDRFLKMMIASATTTQQDSPVLGSREQRRQQYFQKHAADTLLGRIDKPFVTLMLTGIIDHEAIKEVVGEGDDADLPEHERAFKKMQAIFSLNDTESRKVLARTVRLLRDGKFPPVRYPRLYSIISDLQKAKVVRLVRLRNHILTGFERSSIEFSNSEIDSERLYYREYEGRGEPVLDEIYARLRRLKEDRMEQERELQIRTLLRDPGFSSNETRMAYTSLASKDIFLSNTVSLILDAIEGYKASELMDLDSILHNRYLRISNIGEFHYNELPYIKTVIESLDRMIGETNRKMILKRFALQGIISTLKEVYQHIDRTKPSPEHLGRLRN